jgi:hypothetical protein
MASTAVMTQVARKFVAVIGPERNPTIAETVVQDYEKKLVYSPLRIPSLFDVNLVCACFVYLLGRPIELAKI